MRTVLCSGRLRGEVELFAWGGGVFTQEGVCSRVGVSA